MDSMLNNVDAYKGGGGASSSHRSVFIIAPSSSSSLKLRCHRHMNMKRCSKTDSVDEHGEDFLDILETTPAPAITDTIMSTLDPEQDTLHTNSISILPPPQAFSPPVSIDQSSGYILALSILFAARLGRFTSEKARMDVRRVQRDRSASRALDADLRRRRDQWKLSEAARLAQSDVLRVEEVAAKAREAARQQALEQQKYQQEIAKETERLNAEREAARREYEAQQSLLDAEYKKRLEQEQRLLEETRQRQREEEERQRMELEKQRRLLEEARRQKEEEERLAREEALRQKLEERKRLEKEKQRFAVRLEGSVVAERPPKKTLVPGPLEKEATVRLSIAATSLLLGGESKNSIRDFPSIDDALLASPHAVAAHVKAAVDAISSALQLQAMSGSTGPMASMEKPEQDHWMAMTAGRTAVVALCAAEEALCEFKEKSSSDEARQTFQLRTEIALLPPSHPQRIDVVMNKAIALVEQGDARRAMDEVMQDIMEAENEAFYSPDVVSKLLPGSSLLGRAPKAFGAAFTLAYFLNRTLYQRPAKSSDAPAWFENTAQLIRYEMASMLKTAPPDSLEAFAAILSAVLGEDHPVAAEALVLARENMSPAIKQLRLEKLRAQQAELAEKLLEEEWPDAEDIRAARLADDESKTPIAERVWAMRNVAGTLAMGGQGERSRARQLLEQAVLLKQQFAGSPDHPGVLPELMALADVLSSQKEWSDDAAAVAGLVLRVLGNIAGAYSQSNDAVSAALVMEAGLRRYEEIAGVKSSAVRAATRTADQLLEKLDDEQRQCVNKRRGDSMTLLTRLSDALTEQLGAYSGERSGRSKVQDWDEKGVLKCIGRLN